MAGIRAKVQTGDGGGRPRCHHRRFGCVFIADRGSGAVRQDLLEPQFAVEAGSTIVTLPAPIGATASVSELAKGLGEMEQRVLLALGSETLRLSQIAARMPSPVSERTLRRLVARLRERGIVESMGKARATAYRVSFGRGGQP